MNFGVTVYNGVVQSVDAGDVIGFLEVDLTNGTEAVAVYYKCCVRPEDDGQGGVDIYVKTIDDSMRLTGITFSHTNDTWRRKSQPIVNVTGKQNIYLKFWSSVAIFHPDRSNDNRLDYYVSLLDYIEFQY